MSQIDTINICVLFYKFGPIGLSWDISDASWFVAPRGNYGSPSLVRERAVSQKYIGKRRGFLYIFDSILLGQLQTKCQHLCSLICRDFSFKRQYPRAQVGDAFQETRTHFWTFCHRARWDIYKIYLWKQMVPSRTKTEGCQPPDHIIILVYDSDISTTIYFVGFCAQRG
jgi:hypothetical protein